MHSRKTTFCLHDALSCEPFQAFVPAPLPPAPPLVWSAALRRRFDAALVALGRLDAVTALLPNAALLLYSFVRKEAVLSSQIEGTQSSLADLLLYEIDEQPGVPVDDAREVSRCVAALERGLEKLRGGLPLCTRLLCEMHAVLLTHPGGRGKTPGEVRRSQVWIGGTRPGNAVFVPPPADALPDCLAALERFLNDDPEPVPPLIKAALAHVQFETIHPFLDGNGRLGRLLIVLQLVADGVLREPMLYPSLFFKTHRALYYELLNEVRLRGTGSAGSTSSPRASRRARRRACRRRMRCSRWSTRIATASPAWAARRRRRWRYTRRCSASRSPPRPRWSRPRGSRRPRSTSRWRIWSASASSVKSRNRQRGRVFSYRAVRRGTGSELEEPA
jgi:Fic family protein